MQSRGLSECTEMLVQKLFRGEIRSPSDLQVTDHNDSVFNSTGDCLKTGPISLSETLESLQETVLLSPIPASNSAKKRKLHSDMVREGERENEELIRINNQLTENLTKLREENEKLHHQMYKIEEIYDLRKNMKILQDWFIVEKQVIAKTLFVKLRKGPT